MGATRSQPRTKARSCSTWARPRQDHALGRLGDVGDRDEQMPVCRDADRPLDGRVLADQGHDMRGAGLLDGGVQQGQRTDMQARHGRSLGRNGGRSSAIRATIGWQGRGALPIPWPLAGHRESLARCPVNSASRALRGDPRETGEEGLRRLGGRPGREELLVDRRRHVAAAGNSASPRRARSPRG